MTDNEKKFAPDSSSATHSRLRHMLKKPAKMQPPLTPMIDVTFQLLLFFLLTMQFRAAEGRLPANLPAPPEQAAAVTPIEPITVKLLLDSESEIEISIEQISLSTKSLSEFRLVIKKLINQLGDSEIPFVIEPAASIDWQNALNAYNQLRLAGAENIIFDTNNQNALAH